MGNRKNARFIRRTNSIESLNARHIQVERLDVSYHELASNAQLW